MLEIRKENVNDYEQVYRVIKAAFEKAEHSDGNEQDLVKLLRKSNSFIPELSLVAVDENKVIGNAKEINGIVEYDKAFGI